MPDEVVEVEEVFEAPDVSVDAAVEVEPDTFSREYVAELRRESAGYRTEAAKYKDAFEGYDDDGAQAWLTAADLWKTDPAAVSDWMEQQVEAYRATETPDGQFDEGEAPLTYTQLEQVLSERDAEAASEADVEDVMYEASELGFEPGTPEYMQLLYYANAETDGDLIEAAEMVEAQYQSVIEAYIAEKAGGTGIAPVQSGGIPDGETPVIDWKEARASAEARIEHQQ